MENTQIMKKLAKYIDEINVRKKLIQKGIINLVI